MVTRSHSTIGVVGAGGFLGAALHRRLTAGGARPLAFTREHPAMVDGRIHPALREASTIVWAASSVNPVSAFAHPDLARRDESSFVRFVDALTAQSDPGSRVVLLSSGGTVYGAAEPPCTETTPTRPINEYGRTKVVLELALRESPLLSTAVRIGNAYGPGQPAASGQGVISHWLLAAKTGRELVVYGDLDVVRDYVFVDDVVDALLALIAAPDWPHDAYNVGGGRPVTLGEVLQHVERAVGRELDARFEPSRSVDVRRTWLDTSRIEALLGWTPRTALSDGIAAQWRAVLGSGSVPVGQP